MTSTEMEIEILRLNSELVNARYEIRELEDLIEARM